jgi:hypothetical protein
MRVESDSQTLAQSDTRSPEAPAPSDRVWVTTIIAIYLLLGLVYSLAMPMWEAPDEPSHYRRILERARVPGFDASSSDLVERNQPPLYYWLASRVVVVLDSFDPTLANPFQPRRNPAVTGTERFGSRPPLFLWSAENYRFMLGPQLLRWANLVLGALTVWLTYRGACRFAPGAAPVAVAATAVVALTPQFVHLTASISNDASAYLAGAYLFWLLSGLAGEAVAPRDLAWAAAVAIVSPLLIKLTVLPIALAVLATVAWIAGPRYRRQWSRPALAGALLSAALVVALWVHVDSNARALFDTVVWRATHVRPGAFADPAGDAMIFARSHWGLVGWMSAGLSEPVVCVLTFLAGLGVFTALPAVLVRNAPLRSSSQRELVVAGVVLLLLTALANAWAATLWMLTWFVLLYTLVRRTPPFRLGTRRGWGTLWLLLGLTAMIVAKNALATHSGLQARHAFPALGALSVLMAAGWFALLPQPLRQYLPHGVLAMMMTANLLLLLGTIVPIYFQPLHAWPPSVWCPAP